MEIGNPKQSQPNSVYHKSQLRILQQHLCNPLTGPGLSESLLCQLVMSIHQAQGTTALPSSLIPEPTQKTSANNTQNGCFAVVLSKTNLILFWDVARIALFFLEVNLSVE